MNIIEQSPYSPDMPPADFFFFLKLKSPLRGTRFQSIPENAFKKCFDDWIIR